MPIPTMPATASPYDHPRSGRRLSFMAILLGDWLGYSRRPVPQLLSSSSPDQRRRRSRRLSDEHGSAGQGGIFYYALDDHDGPGPRRNEQHLSVWREVHRREPLHRWPGRRRSWCDYCGYDADMIRFVCDDSNEPPAHGLPAAAGYAGLRQQQLFGRRMPACATWPSAMARCTRSATASPPTIHQQLGNRADGNAIDASMY